MGEAGSIPHVAGVGLRPPHYEAFLEKRPVTGWLEAHPENYMGADGVAHRALEALRADFPLSFHGVGLSLASSEPLDKNHLRRLRALADRYEPALVSEHLAWSAWGGRFFNDLFPAPLTEESLHCALRNINEMQEALGRVILIENPSLYGLPAASDIPEPEFLSALAERSGCGLLMDVNNVYVSASNLGFDARAYIDALPASHIREIHLAGHAITEEGVRIDDHSRAVSEPVWALCRRLLTRTGRLPILIEWDTAIPDAQILIKEARKADEMMKNIAEAA